MALLLGLVAGAGLLTVLLIRDEPVAHSRGDATSIPASVPAALRSFYAQTIAWKACDGGVQCGRLTVPLDYADPDAGTIQLALVRRPATNPAHRTGSLLFNPGGPGESGVKAVQDHTNEYFTTRLRSRFDLVGFDPRGVGQSAPIRCRSAAPPADSGPVDGTPDDPAEVDRYLASLKDFAAACQAGAGARLARVSTIEAARDMDVLRAVLGDARLHYLGLSYGTYLGALYAEQFPDWVGRLVLDAAFDPRINALDSLRDQAAGFQLALEAFLADCATRTDCPLGTDVPGARQHLAELLARLDHTPLPVGEQDTLDKDTALWAISDALYSKQAWPRLEEALRQARAGHGADLLELITIPYADNFWDALTAVTCLDWPPALTSTEQVQAQLPSFRQASSVFGEWFAWRGLGCADWPVKPVGTPHKVTAPGTPPILVLGTTRDPATPYAGAKGLAEQLASGVLLTHDGDGHGAYNIGSSCVDDTVDAYLIEGRPPTKGIRCT
ncbi:alpha/beta hydrolase [Streptomyces sp. SYSU K217416]